jgi:RNA polymerase-associated protein
LIEVDLKNKPSDLVQRNPYGKVPVLVDGDGVIYESAIIDEYLEEKFAQVRLMPADLLLRAKARIWVDYMSTRLHAVASDITHNREAEKARERMRQHLTTLDKEMAGRKYLVGEYSLADISYIPFYTRRERYDVVIDDTYPNLKRWGEDLVARPRVAPTI